MKNQGFASAWLPVFIALFPAMSCHAAFLEKIEPSSGMAGDTITVTGVFDPSEATLKVGGVAVVPAGVNASALTFVIPPGLVSGVVEVTDGGDPATHPFPLLVRREIGGVFQPPAGVAADGFTVIAGGHESLVAANGAFTTRVTTGRPTTVWVFKDGQPSTFLGTVVDSDASAVVSAETTALAMVINNPLAGRRSPAETAALRTALSGHGEFANLAGVIALAAQENRDYLDDAQLDPPLVAMVETAAEPEPAPIAEQSLTFTPLGFTDAKLAEINPPGVSPTFMSTLTADPKRPNDFFLLENARTTSRNSLDWGMELFRVNPQSFPNGLTSISDLDGLSTLAPGNTVPLQTGFARAELLSAKLDLFAVLADELFNIANGLVKTAGGPSLDPPKSGEFRIDRRIPEIYLLQAYSGNVPNGIFLQEGVLDAGDPNSQWAFSLAGNLLIATLDAVGVFIDAGELLGVDSAFVANLNVNLAKSLAVYRGREDLDLGTFLDLAKTAATTTVKTFYENSVKTVAGERLAERAAKTLTKSFDILGKVSNGLQAAERTFGLVRDRTLAVERSILVVGSPFSPYITAVSPSTIREGDAVTVTGGNFGTVSSALTVSLCRFNDTSGGVEAEIVVTPLSVSPNQIRFTIPAAASFRSAFPDGEAFICIVKGGQDTPDDPTDGEIARSTAVGEEGKVIMPPPPTVLGIQPSSPGAGGVPDVIVGGNGAIRIAVQDGWEKAELLLDGFTLAEVFQARQGEIIALLPTLSVGAHTMQIRANGELGPAFAFNVVRPTDPVRSYLGGQTITITLMDMSNQADGEISLKEALLLANGGLGRPLEEHVEGEPAGTRREVDHVSGSVGGVGRRDTVRVTAALEDGVYAINEAPPVLDSGDRIRLGGVTLDATGAPAGADGFVVDGVNDVEIRDVVLKGFKGEGIRVTNGSLGGDYLNITVDGAGGDGIFLDTDCAFHAFTTVEILNVGGRGLNLSGNCDHNTFTGFQIDGTGDTALRLAFGSDENVFSDFSITNVTGTGVLLEEDVTRNRFKELFDVSVCTGNGIHLTGAGTADNSFFSDLSSLQPNGGKVAVSPAVRDCDLNGILIEGGASSNHLCPKFVSNNGLDGIRITGAGTFDNTVGHPYRVPPNTQTFPTQTLYFTIVTDNAGHGIVLDPGSSQTLLTGLSVHGNAGDGIRLNNCSFNSILSVRCGIQDFIVGQPAIADPNTGASIRLTGSSTNNELGTALEVTKFSFGTSPTQAFSNILANDLGGGVILDGECDHNLFYGTFVGGTTAAKMRVGGNGIALLNGASSNRIGSLDFSDEFIVESCAGAAILIDGATSVDNTVQGVTIGGFGSTPEMRVHAGIHLRNGTRNNLIGGPGPMIGGGGGSPFGPRRETVAMSNLLGTGIWLEACGGSVGTDGAVSSPNRIWNTTVNGCETGYLISDNAQVNEIGGFFGSGPKGGGFFPAEQIYTVDSNTIFNFGTAGVRYSRMSLTSPLLRNPIRNLTLSTGAAAPAQPLSAAVPAGVGILIDPDASHIVVGEDPATPIVIRSCSAGVYIDQSSHNRIQALTISSFNFSNAAGIALRDSTENVIGGAAGFGNDIRDLKLSGGAANGIALFGSDENTVTGNVVAFCGGSGVYLEDSALNLIGGAGRHDGNVILGNSAHGLHFAGAACLANRAHSNFIGIDPGGKRADPSDRSYAHTLHGVFLETGASGNRIGGEFVPRAAGVTVPVTASQVPSPAGNSIIGNTGRGVLVDGGSTRANRILDNSITANLEGGIVLAAGNDQIPAPSGTHAPGVASGTVADINAVPPGSIVQIFSDTEDQGEMLLGTAIVKPGGTWTATGLVGAVYENVTATVTHPTDFSTSQFALLGSEAGSFTVERTVAGPPVSVTVPFSSETVAHRMTLTATGSDVRVGELSFMAEGTLDDAVAVAEAKIFRDGNGNGVLDVSDPELAAGATYDADNGLLVFAEISEIIEAGTGQDWLVVYQPAPGVAQEGDTFALKLNDATAVDAETFFPSGIPVTPTNPFPVLSDNFTIGAQAPGLTFAAYIAAAFPGETDPEIIGPLADHDGDLIPNLLEFLSGTDPDDPASAAHPRAVKETGRFGIEFQRARNLEGITVSYEGSEDLDGWDPSTEGIISVDPGDPFDTVRYTLPLGGDIRFLRIKVTLNAGG